jgi:photosystem II stability/assembly factor-like uncharacterized protein
MQRPWLIAGFAAACLLAAAGRQDRWEVIGPGGGGTMYYPTISPLDPSRVLVYCDMTGSYITSDAGATWRMANLRATTSFFVFDPVQPDTIYAYGLGLWRSTDAGASWSLVYPGPDSVKGTIISGDHAEETIALDSGGYVAMTAMAVDPADSNVLYAGAGRRLIRSDDWGGSWYEAGSLPEPAARIYINSASPQNDRTIYVLGSKTITIREGGEWRPGAVPPGVASFTDTGLGFTEGGQPVIYITAGGTLRVSEDAAATWHAAADLPGTKAVYAGVATSLFHGDVVYLSYSNRTEPDGRYWFGVARSNDRGQSWSLVYKSVNQSPSNVQDAWLPGAFGAGWAGNPIERGLAVAPTDPYICYGTDSGRTMRTVDGGQSWQAVYSRRTEDGGYTTTGLDVTTCYGVHWDPFDAARMFISYTDIVLFRSENGGNSWVYSGSGVTSDWRNTVYWMEFDPDVRGRVWAAMSRTHDLPRPKMWRTTSTSTYQGGVAVSDDGGRTWRKPANGMPQTAATHVLLDPTSPAEGRVLYAAGFGRGVYKSVDGGASWALKNKGIAGVAPLVWRLSRDPDGVLYAIVARRSENGSYGDANDGALYRSGDGAESWTRVALPGMTNGPNGLAIDPDDPQRLYLAAWGRRVNGGDTDGGIFVSTDGGMTWRNTLAADQHIYDVTVDRRNGILYACGFESSVWRSDDRGESWRRLRGYNFKWGHRVIPDPQDPGMIYVTTFGGSVWHGPADGDPQALEDIAGPAALRFTQGDGSAGALGLVTRPVR